MVGNRYVWYVYAAVMRHMAGNTVIVLCCPHRCGLGTLVLGCACTVAALAGVEVLAARGELHADMRVVAGDAAHLARLHIALAFLHPLHVRCHDHLVLRALVLGHEHVHHL